MEGKDKPDDSWADKVNNCETPDEFLKLFVETGIPGDEWKNSGWLQNRAMLPPDKGGIGRRLNSLAKAIADRFDGHPKFVAWMEGKEKPADNWYQVVNKCITPEDFLMLFKSLGIPGDKWKSSEWLQKKAMLQPDRGGIGRKLFRLTVVLRKRFGGHPQFVAWMGGNIIPPNIKIAAPKIATPEDAIKVIREQAAELGITVDELLDPGTISRYIRRKPALREALKFFK